MGAYVASLTLKQPEKEDLVFKSTSVNVDKE
jgi:hypothetical protein